MSADNEVPVGVPAVAQGIVELFETGNDADCDVVFCPEEGSSEERMRKRPRLSEAVGPARAMAPASDFDEQKLPGHLLILRLASPRFRAQLERWYGGGGAKSAQEVASSSSTGASRPQLRVPLGCEAEVPYARAAIGYAYTGRVAADSVEEVLEVRRQAAYLQINGCMDACDKVLLGMLAADSRIGGGEALDDQAGCAAPTDRPAPPALQFMACGVLLPDPAEDPTFARVLAAAKDALVRHFGDALAALNTPSLHQQLLQLPAAAVEALLGSDAFGTDTEDSVLLLLATWVKANHGQTDAAERAQLCRLVRLVQLGHPYLTAILPALAADYETGAAGSPYAWFPISVAEAGFVNTVATLPAGSDKQRLLSFGGQVYDTQSPRYSTSPRPQCLSGAGRSYEWAISQKKLLKVMGRLLPQGTKNVWGTFTGGHHLCASGFEWQSSLWLRLGTDLAGVYLKGVIPAAYSVPGSHLGSDGCQAVTVVGLNARIAVHGWRDGLRHDAYQHEFAAARKGFVIGPNLTNTSMGFGAALSLMPPQQEGGAGGGGGEGVAALLEAWAPYLHDGSVTGSLTLLPA